MKTILFFLCIFSTGCGSYVISNENTIREVGERYAVIITSDSSSGSAVSIGKGYFLTSYHLLGIGNGKYKKFTLLKGLPKSWKTSKSTDKNPKIISGDSSLDIVLVKSFIGHNDNEIALQKDPRIGEKTFWIQPTFYDQEDDFYLRVGEVSKKDSKRIFVDAPILDGASGGGMFNEQGELVGIAESYIMYENVIISGCFLSSTSIDRFISRSGLR